MKKFYTVGLALVLSGCGVTSAIYLSDSESVTMMNFEGSGGTRGAGLAEAYCAKYGKTAIFDHAKRSHDNIPLYVYSCDVE